MAETMRQALAKFKLLAAGGSSRGARIVFWAAAAVLLAVVWFVPWVLTVPLGFTITLPYEPDGESRYLAVAGPVAGALGWADWVSEREVPSACVAAVVAAEDTKFYEHQGVDWESLESAWGSNQKAQEKAQAREAAAKRKSQKSSSASKAKVRGASTVTQQLIKNLYLSRDRSYLRKAREIVGALLLEQLVSKETIMTWYLNVVEFGPRTYGLEAAAQRYFKKPARQLRPHECVSLSVVLPSPNKWNASLVSRSYSSFFTKRYTVIARRMHILGHVGASTMREVRGGVPFFLEPPRAAVPSDSEAVEDLVLPEDPEGGAEEAPRVESEARDAKAQEPGASESGAQDSGSSEGSGESDPPTAPSDDAPTEAMPATQEGVASPSDEKSTETEGQTPALPPSETP